LPEIPGSAAFLNFFPFMNRPTQRRKDAKTQRLSASARFAPLRLCALTLKAFLPAGLFGVLLLLIGCATPSQPHIPLSGNIMIDGPRMVDEGPPRDKLLWEYRTAAAAMRNGNYPLAKQYLDDAITTMGGISTDQSAKLARNYFHPESTKKFIGEPYERVMAYYYRGILYWMDGEPDNARACFLSAQIQDADAENHQYAADYAILDYLAGLATTRLNGDGSDAFDRAQKESRLSKLPPYNREANVLILLEFGAGPVKYATGEYGEELRFRIMPTPVRAAVLHVDGQTMLAGAVDDLEFQATTRGGRVMDHVLGNKAVFKTATGVAGTAAIMGGAIAASQGGHTAQNVGLGLMAAGLVATIFSAATVPTADTRSWNNLPRFLSFADISLPPGPHVVTIEFQDGAGRPLSNLTKTITINVPSDGKDKVIFVSDQSATPQTL
jgi:hypothetical protein